MKSFLFWSFCLGALLGVISICLFETHLLANEPDCEEILSHGTPLQPDMEKDFRKKVFSLDKNALTVLIRAYLWVQEYERMMAYDAMDWPWHGDTVPTPGDFQRVNHSLYHEIVTVSKQGDRQSLSVLVALSDLLPEASLTELQLRFRRTVQLEDYWGESAYGAENSAEAEVIRSIGASLHDLESLQWLGKRTLPLVFSDPTHGHVNRLKQLVMAIALSPALSHLSLNAEIYPGLTVVDFFLAMTLHPVPLISSWAIYGLRHYVKKDPRVLSRMRMVAGISQIYNFDQGKLQEYEEHYRRTTASLDLPKQVSQWLLNVALETHRKFLGQVSDTLDSYKPINSPIRTANQILIDLAFQAHCERFASLSPGELAIYKPEEVDGVSVYWSEKDTYPLATWNLKWGPYKVSPPPEAEYHDVSTLGASKNHHFIDSLFMVGGTLDEIRAEVRQGNFAAFVASRAFFGFRKDYETYLQSLEMAFGADHPEARVYFGLAALRAYVFLYDHPPFDLKKEAQSYLSIPGADGWKDTVASSVKDILEMLNGNN